MCSGRTSYNMHQSILAVTIPTQQPDLKKMEDNALYVWEEMVIASIDQYMTDQKNLCVRVCTFSRRSI